MDWEKANATKIHDLQWQALSLQADGHYADADKKYQELFHLAEGRKLSAAIQSQLVEARSAWDDVKVKLRPTRPGPGVGPVPIRPDEPATRPAPTSLAGPAWVEAHRDELNDLLAQAEELSRGPDKLKTLLKYKQLVDLLGSRLHDVQDPALRQKLSAALETRKTVADAAQAERREPAAHRRHARLRWVQGTERAEMAGGARILGDARHLMNGEVKLVPQRAQNEEYLAALEGSVVVYLKTKQMQKAGELLDGRKRCWARSWRTTRPASCWRTPPCATSCSEPRPCGRPKPSAPGWKSMGTPTTN